MKLKGNVSMPKSLELILSSFTESEEESIEVIEEDRERNPIDYLKAMKRVDVMLLSIFYGLFKTMELPPQDKDSYPLDGTYEFNVNIEQAVNNLRYILFLIWVSENGPAGKKFDIEHRILLYNFLEKILDDGYIVKVAFPFYLEKSADPSGDVSFIDRLSESRNVPFELHPFAPEAIALEYHKTKFDFEAYIEDALDKFIHPDE